MKRNAFSLFCLSILLASLFCGCVTETPQTSVTPPSASIGPTPSVPSEPSEPSNLPTDFILSVSPQGDDAADGVSAPVQSIWRALELAGEAIASKDVTIQLSGDTFSISQPIVITNTHTDRENGYVLTIRGQENTVISGGLEIDGWQRHSGQIWKVALPQIDRVNGFYADGLPMPIASQEVTGRFVNSQGENGIVQENKSSYCDFSQYNPQIKIASCAVTLQLPEAPDPQALQKDLEHLVLLFDQTFCRTGMQFSQMSINGSAVTLLCSDATLQTLNGAQMADYDLSANRYHLANSYLFLDEEGEYYFDETSHTLYFYTENNPASMDCVVPVSDGLLQIQGTDKQLACNILLENLTFAYGTSGLLQGPYKQVISDYYVSGTADGFTRYLMPGQIEVDHASNLTIRGCKLQNCDTSGITLRTHVYQTAIEGCNLENINGSGLVVGTINLKNGYGLVDRKPHPENWQNITSVNKSSVIPAGITIANNRITNCGIQSIGSGGIVVFYGHQVNILHNTVENIGGAGIYAGWGYANYSVKKDATKNTGDILIAQNSVIRPCMRITNSGGICSMGAFFGEGLLIRENFVDMTGSIRSGMPAIYLDDGSEWVYATANVCVGTTRWLCARAMPVSLADGVCVTGELQSTTIMNCSIEGNYAATEVTQKEYAPGIPWPLATEVEGANVIIGDNTANDQWQSDDKIMAIVSAAGAQP